LDSIYGKGNSQHVEYGGRIVQLADGTYAYTSPVTQNHATTVDVDDGAKEGTRIPGGSTNIGDYHTAGGPGVGHFQATIKEEGAPGPSLSGTGVCAQLSRVPLTCPQNPHVG
jgi:hypothetical protein